MKSVSPAKASPRYADKLPKKEDDSRYAGVEAVNVKVHPEYFSPAISGRGGTHFIGGI